MLKTKQNKTKHTVEKFLVRQRLGEGEVYFGISFSEFQDIPLVYLKLASSLQR